MNTVKERVKLIFISCGSTDGLIGNSQNYHNFLNQNNVFHFYQIEQGQGHNSVVWNRSFYNTAQRLFRVNNTGIVPKMTSIIDHKTLLIRNGLSLTPSTINVIRARTGISNPQIFSLDGRVITPFRPEMAVSQPFVRNK